MDDQPVMPLESPRRPSWTYVALPASILIAAFLIAGSMFYTRGGGTAKPSKVTFKITSQDRIVGNPKAKVTIVEYSDFQCPFCRKFWEATYPKLKAQYLDTGTARLVYRHFPLSFHPMAYPSALAAECAGEQGKFWELHDKIFEEQQKRGDGTIAYTAADIHAWAGEIGMDTGKLTQCMDADTYRDKIAKDNQSGVDVGVDGTPTFFINGVPLVGAQPLEAFVQAIEGK